MFQPGGPSFLQLTRQALSSTKRGYDLLAPRFDLTPFRTPDAVLDEVATLLGRRPIERAMDLCCGTGAGMRMLRPLVGDEVLGLDFSPGMLAEAERRLVDSEGTAVLGFVEGDALALGFDREFDVVTCFGALGHVLPEDRPRFLEGIARALKPGGRFVFVTTRMPSRRSGKYWAYKGFNGVMRVRNAVLRPEFIMYYLTFTVPEVLGDLDAAGFEVVLYDREIDEGRFVVAVCERRPIPE